MIVVKCLHVCLLLEYNIYMNHFLIDDSYSKVGLREILKAIYQKNLFYNYV